MLWERKWGEMQGQWEKGLGPGGPAGWQVGMQGGVCPHSKQHSLGGWQKESREAQAWPLLIAVSAS